MDMNKFNSMVIGCDMASGPDQTVFIENNADFDVKKMREMLRTIQKHQHQMDKRMSKVLFDQLHDQVFDPYFYWTSKIMSEHEAAIRINVGDYYPTGLTILPQAGSQVVSAFPEPSAWREFIETKGPVDDGVSWLFRKSLVSTAVTTILARG